MREPSGRKVKPTLGRREKVPFEALRVSPKDTDLSTFPFKDWFFIFPLVGDSRMMVFLWLRRSGWWFTLALVYLYITEFFDSYIIYVMNHVFTHKWNET